MLRRLLPLLLLAALLAPAAHADVVRLRTGESVKCRLLQERSDDKTLVVEDLLSGAIRAFAWEAVEPLDRSRIRIEWNIDESGSSRTAKGHRVVMKLGDEQQELFGLVEKEVDGQVFLRRNGDVNPIPRAQIVEITDELMDPREIWNAQQLMERYAQSLQEREPPDEIGSTEGRVAFQVGDYAEWAGALKEALEAFRRAAADPDFPNRLIAEQRAVKVEALLKDRAALDYLRDLKTKLSSNLFRAVRKGLTEFDTKNPGASEAVLKALATFKDTFTKKRDKYFRQMARYDFPRGCVRLIEAKVREKDFKLSDAKSWARKELPEAAFKALTEKMGTKDEVTDVEARQYWDTRWQGMTKGSWLRASYGSGSLIPYPGKLAPPKPKPAGNNPNKGGNNQGPAPKLTLPKAPTPDQWWNTHGGERVSWLMAHFVQTSALFEVSDDLEKKPCLGCQGSGIKSSLSQTGESIPYLCDRCGGAQADYTVKFR
jgi:hypothetical protein